MIEIKDEGWFAKRTDVRKITGVLSLALLNLDRSSLESLKSEVKRRRVKVALASADLSSEAGVNSVEEPLRGNR
jgi:short-subunit dehydrogenase